MPSPVGHALGGVIAGWLVQRPAVRAGTSAVGIARSVADARPAGSPLRRQTALLATLGMAADADFLFGTHSTYSHSIGAVGVVFLVALVAGRRSAAQPIRTALAAAAAYGTHVLFDWLGSDTSLPIGIMALWPFSDGFHQSGLHVFDAISRRYWLPGFWAHNLLAVAREVLILVPVLLVVWRTRGNTARVDGKAKAAANVA